MAVVKKCRTTDVTDGHRWCEASVVDVFFVGVEGGLIFD
jgi:hypothetical protein